MTGYLRLAAGLIAAAIVLAAPALAEPKGNANEDLLMDCKSDAFIAWAAAGQPSFSCAEISREVIEHNGFRFILRILRDKSLDAKTAEAYAKLAAKAAKGAAEVYYGMGDWRLGHLTFVIVSEKTDTGKAFAEAHQLSDAECGMHIYLKKSAQSVAAGTEPFENTIAHELFHCVQYFSVPEQMALFGSGADWWIEQSAEFMSHLVTPDEPRLKEKAKQFDETSAKIPLTEMLYEGFVCFAWLHGEDPKLIERVIRAMPKGAANPGAAKQQAALIQVLGGEALERYALDYLSGKILDPVGRPVGASIDWGAPVIIDKTGETAFKAKPFTIMRARVQWQDGDYILATKAQKTPHFKMRDGGDGAWADRPEEVITECAEPRNFDLASFPLNDSGFSLVSSKTRSCEICAVTEQIDQCAVGNWEIDPDALLFMLANQMDPKTAYFAGKAGAARTIFRKDQTAAFIFENLKIVGRVKPQPGESASAPGATITVTTEGTQTGNWSAADGLLTFCTTEGDIQFSANIDIDGPIAPQTVYADGVVQNGRFNYTCAGDDLVLEWAGPETMSDGTKPAWTLKRSE